jgi:SAM-dependent methyltransferase
LEKFCGFAGIEPSPGPPFERALDVACGTGQSTVAVAELAESVIGVDPSAVMLEHASPGEGITYRTSAAEKIALPDERFELITVGQAFHWLDRDAFLAEARRLLRPPGWLVIYTSWFQGKMKEEAAFSKWFKGAFQTRYPAPPRDRSPITSDFANRHGFALRGEDEFTNDVLMTADGFSDYQVTTTNVIAALMEGKGRLEDARNWIRDAVLPFFGGCEKRTFLFWGKIWYLQKLVL